MVHQVVKAEKIAAVGAVALEQKLIVPAMFRREGIDQYKGAKDDAISVIVDGVLPYRSYGWRNDRSTEIQFDDYVERKVTVTFGDDIYSAVKLTDEQNDFDLGGWTKLASKQVEAIGRGLERKAVDAMTAAPYEVVVQLNATDLRGSLIKLKLLMDQLNIVGPRKIAVASDLEAAILADEKLQIASAVGDAQAQSALVEATLARRFGFDFVSARELGFSVALVPDAFIFATGAPSVPQSVPFGASASYNGVALRWIRDYDMTRTTDRSLFNTYQKFQYVDDPLVGRIASGGNAGQPFVSTVNHFVRAVKVTLGSAYTVTLPNAGTKAELSAATGVAAVTAS